MTETELAKLDDLLEAKEHYAGVIRANNMCPTEIRRAHNSYKRAGVCLAAAVPALLKRVRVLEQDAADLRTLRTVAESVPRLVKDIKEAVQKERRRCAVIVMQADADPDGDFRLVLYRIKNP